MAKDLIAKFNEQTGGEFGYIKLTEVEVALREKTVTLNLIYPESKTAEVLKHRERIVGGLKRTLALNAAVEVKLTVSHFDADFFRSRLMRFLEKYPSVTATVPPQSIVVNDGENKSVAISMPPHIYDYCLQNKFADELKSFVSLNYCDDIAVSISVENPDGPDGGEDDPSPLSDADADKPRFVFDDGDGGRFISVKDVDALIGAPIYEKAIYIEDAKSPRERMVVCGKLDRVTELTRKLKDGEKKIDKYYKLTIEDFTGSIECLYFPNKYTVEKAALLKQGKEVIVRGALEPDSRRRDSFVYFLRDISYCTLPSDFKLNRMRRAVEDKYRVVEPQKYKVTAQASLFDGGASAAPLKQLADKSFCVFDIETTGLKPEDSEIIEIAAVKITDGKFDETFHSLVDPGVPVPERITELTGICDRDVIGKPKIDDVLTDFYKFSDGCTLVAQHIQFDYSFLALKGKALNIYFDNEKMDTEYLARKYYPNWRNYKLDTICEKLGVELKRHHRAFDDAFATAEIFLKIMRNVDDNA
ncbi:MAG: 3'-5' exoribonuclease [Clostridiales bacterium]|jgi:DNA polymerase III epsilon subunit family exonuclease|nr:3'-5' exoribonuclease [Clostridiales bacterium]